MSLYSSASRMRPFKDRGEGSSGMTPPLIDRSKVAASLLLRCDQSASVSIYITGLPFPQVTWYLGSRPIVDSDEFRVARDADGRKHSLVVARVTEDLEGGLRVKAVNCAGQDQWEFEIKTYKLFSGRSQPDGNKSTTLPLLQPKGRRKGSSTPSPKSLHKKTNKQFEMTQDEYENWQKEMERRSHMRSIDDILESLSDEDSDTVHSPSTENKRISEDNSFAMETHPSSSSATDSFASPPPPPIRHATTGSFQEQLSSESRTRDFGFRDSPPVGTDMPVSRRPEEDSLRITQGLKSTTERRDIPRTSLENDIPIWEMFGVKLSEFCRTILDSNAVNFDDRQSSNHGTIHGSTTHARDNYFVEVTSRPSKPQSHSVPVGRKALGSRPVENQTKPVYPENTRIPISRERVGQQKAATVRSLSEDSTKPVTLMPGGGGSPNLRPPIHPKGDATQRVMQMLEGSGSANTRPPLAPKPSFNKEERQMRGNADQDPKTSDISGSLKSDSFVASLPRHRAEAEASNSDSKFTPNAQTSHVRRGTASDSFEPRGSAWEPSERDALLQRTSSLDRGQNLVQWGPAVDRHFAEVRGDNQRPRLEIKNPTTTRSGEPIGQILETHFNEPSSGRGSSQKIPEALIPSREPVSELPINDKADRVKADSIAFPTQSDVIRKKPPIAKDKPSWNPATGAKGRGIPRACPALPSKAPEHVEIGSKPNLWSQPTMNSEPPSMPSKPTLVRRARSQSSGRSDEMAISCEEEEDTSGYLYGATSAVQLSYNQELDMQNPTQRGAEQSRQSGIGRFQASAAKSEGLLTARKRSASPIGAGAVNQNGSGREWRVRMPVSKSVDLLDAANSVEAMQRIGRRSLSKEWQVVTVTTKEEITILHRPATATGVTKVTNPTANITTAKDYGFVYRPQLRPSKPFAV